MILRWVEQLKSKFSFLFYYVKFGSHPVLVVPLLKVAVQLTGLTVSFGASMDVALVQLLVLVLKFMSLSLYLAVESLRAMAARMLYPISYYWLLLF